MPQHDSVKPLVERIVSQPLQFRRARGPDTLESRPASCVVISADEFAPSDAQTSPQLANERQTAAVPAAAARAKRAFMPKSFSEALKMYTARTPAHDVELSDEKYDSSEDEAQEARDAVTTEPAVLDSTDGRGSSSSDDSEEFHEAKEYVGEGVGEAVGEDTGEDIGEDLGEDVGEDIDEDIGEDIGGDLGESLGESLEENDQADPANDCDDDSTANSTVDPVAASDDASSQDDADFELDARDSDDSEDSEDSEDSVDDIPDAEKASLFSEAQEHLSNHQAPSNVAAVENASSEDPELKHKLPLAKRTSPTPPTTLPDTHAFYQFNETPADRGSNGSLRIVKNWGPQLSTMKPRGLLNHGVTCYTNAAVQAMLHIPAIQHYLFAVLRGHYKDTIAPNSVTQTLAETSKRMWSPEASKNTFINPKKLIGRLDDINCMMSEWQQEDSHEYFMSLMSRLQEDSVPRGHKMTESIIYDIFGGLLMQEVTCKSCGEISKTEQPIYDLSLHLKGRKPSTSSDNANDDSASAESPQRRYSIEKSIRDFFNPELIKVDKENKEGYVCEKCHKTTNALKHNSILRAPETLLIHLKKFRFNGTSSSKLKQAVSYPMFLDLTEYCDTLKKYAPVKYQLISVVVHEGRSLSSGHYIAHCKQPDGSWATYDDEYINKISERQMLKEPGAYYLIYTRLTPKSVKWLTKVKPDQLGVPSSAGPANHTTNNDGGKTFKKKRKNKNKKRRLNK